MKKSILTMGLVALAFTVTAATIKTGESIAFLGDSITQQGWSHASGYVRLCEAAFQANGLEVKIFPAGIGGNKSPQMLDRLERDVLKKKPTYMTLSCGVNDVWHGQWGVPLEKYKENITKLVDKVQAAGVKVIILTATMIGEDAARPNNKKLAPYNDFLRALAKEKGFPLVDLNAEMQRQVADYRTRSGAKGNFLTVDGVHMDYLGNTMMARLILKDGLGFADGEMKKAEESFLGKKVSVKLLPSNRDVLVEQVAITGRIYRDNVEKAIAAKMTPAEYLAKTYGNKLNEKAADLFSETFKTGCKIAWIGDTVMWHDLAYKKNPYVGICEKTLKAMGRDVKGFLCTTYDNTSTRMLSRLQVDVLDKKPEHVVISAGLTDLQSRVSLEKFKANLTKIVDTVRAADIKVIMLTSTMLGEDAANDNNKKLAPYNDFVRTLAKEKGCTLVDVNAKMQRRVADYRARSGLTDKFFLSWNNVHLSFLGNVLVARAILKDGFGLTDADMAKADDIIAAEKVWVSTCAGSRDVYLGDAIVTGELFLGVVENAIADKIEPYEYIRLRLGPALNQVGEDLFNTL